MPVATAHAAVHDTALDDSVVDDSVDDPKLMHSDSINKTNKCATCGKEFRRVYDLNRHQKLHTGQKPHGCHRCGKKFSRADALIRHMRPLGSCAQRFSLQTAQAASSVQSSPTPQGVQPVLGDHKHGGFQPATMQLAPQNMRPQYMPVINPIPANMRPEDISALVHRVHTLEARVSQLEARLNRTEQRINQIEIIKAEHN